MPLLYDSWADSVALIVMSGAGWWGYLSTLFNKVTEWKYEFIVQIIQLGAPFYYLCSQGELNIAVPLHQFAVLSVD